MHMKKISICLVKQQYSFFSIRCLQSQYIRGICGQVACFIRYIFLEEKERSVTPSLPNPHLISLFEKICMYVWAHTWSHLSIKETDPRSVSQSEANHDPVTPLSVPEAVQFRPFPAVSVPASGLLHPPLRQGCRSIDFFTPSHSYITLVGCRTTDVMPGLAVLVKLSLLLKRLEGFQLF